MNILSLTECQKEKNNKILTNDNLSEYKLFARKHLELQVKLSSLAQETKCYKYWIDDNSQLDMDLIFNKYIEVISGLGDKI